MTTAIGFALFATVLGDCGIAWSGHGVCGVQLPESSAAATRARMLRRLGTVAEASPTQPIREAITGIQALLSGAPRDLTDVMLDTTHVADFAQRVYVVTRRIAPGSTRTYGEIATELGDAGAARAVGRALGDNPYPLIVPCHRVLAARNRAGGFSAHGGVTTKLRLLEIERRRIPFELT
jgi:methylated-DNA-[protein]-cysteine S-methyltransferase